MLLLYKYAPIGLKFLLNAVGWTQFEICYASQYMLLFCTRREIGHFLVNFLFTTFNHFWIKGENIDIYITDPVIAAEKYIVFPL